jgi:hypothetical protein
VAVSEAVVPQGAAFPVEAFPEVVFVAAALVADSRRREVVHYRRHLRHSQSPRLHSIKHSQLAVHSSKA